MWVTHTHLPCVSHKECVAETSRNAFQVPIMNINLLSTIRYAKSCSTYFVNPHYRPTGTLHYFVHLHYRPIFSSCSCFSEKLRSFLTCHRARGPSAMSCGTRRAGRVAPPGGRSRNGACRAKRLPLHPHGRPCPSAGAPRTG